MSQLITAIALFLTLPNDANVRDLHVDRPVRITLTSGQELVGTVQRSNGSSDVVVAQTIGETSVRYSVPLKRVKSMQFVVARKAATESKYNRTMAELAQEALFGN